MKIYGLYKIVTPNGSGTGHIVMSHISVDSLREAANVYFKKPENFVGRFQQQLTISPNAMSSNRVGSDGGGQQVDIYIEIREVELPGLK